MTAVHDAVQVGAEIAAPFLRVGFPEQRRGTHVRVRSGVAGVVDQQRDGAERCLGLFERGFHRSVVADIRKSEEHTSELQSLMRISYAVFCLKKKKQLIQNI